MAYFILLISFFSLNIFFTDPSWATYPSPDIAHWDLSVSDESNDNDSQKVQKLGKEQKYDAIILGTMKDKDIEGIISYLPKDCEILVCNLKTERAANSNELASVCAKLGYKHRQFSSVQEAMEYSENKKTLVTGSFYTVSEARKYLQLKGHSEL